MADVKNLAKLIGYVGKKPRLVPLNNGKIKITFNMSTTDLFQDEYGNPQKDTHWHQIVAFGKIAERVHRNISAGTVIIVTGKIIYRNYTDKHGITRRICEIYAFEVLEV